MTIFLIILAVILLIIDFLIFCPISIKLEYDNELRLKIGYLFPLFRILPPKPQKIKPEKKKKEKKKAGKTDKSEETEKKKNPISDLVHSHGLSGLIELIKALAKIALEAVNKITEHTVISKMQLNLQVATDDAAQTAITYGNACSAIFPAIAIIENHVKKCRHKENVYPCFTETETKIHFVLKARIVPFFILSAALKALFATIKAIAKSR